jgi:hypothetical protein
MAKHIFLFIIMAVIAAGSNAQSVLLEKDLDESVYLKKKGPNKKRFLHLYYDYELYAPAESKALYEFAYSYRWYVGLRNYHRIASHYIMGLSLEFGWENFRIEQNNQKTFPATGIHKKETLGTSNIGLEYFNRILFTEREHALGIWVDAGIYGNLNLNSRHVVKDKADPSADVRYHKEINRGLKYLNPWEYGVKGRIGYKRYALTGTYRFSDWLTNPDINPEPPRITLGFELGIY